MNLPIVLHCSATREEHGGIQSVLAYHHVSDAAHGFQPRFVSCFGRSPLFIGDAAALAGHGWETVGALRRRFARAAAARPATLAIYHDGWGLELFAPLDAAQRRVVMVHTEQPHFDDLVRRQALLVDGFLTVSQALASRIRRILPDFPVERIRALPLFVDPPPWLAEKEFAPPLRPGPFRLGYAGRISRVQKRLDRLPVLLAELDRRGLEYNFEVMGAGDYDSELKRRVGAHPRVKFVGWRQGTDYWQTIASWQAITLFSDFEGFNRVCMEAMAGGVVPVHPEFSPAAAELLGPAAKHGLYPVGDMTAAADRIADLAAMDWEKRVGLLRAGRRHLAAHSPANYSDRYREFLNELLAVPSRAQVRRLPAWHDWLLLGTYTRLFRRRF